MRVLIVDDHPLFRDGVSGLLASVPDTVVVGTAATAEEAVREATLTRPDVVLLDLNLGGVLGLPAALGLDLLEAVALAPQGSGLATLAEAHAPDDDPLAPGGRQGDGARAAPDEIPGVRGEYEHRAIGHDGDPNC